MNVDFDQAQEFSVGFASDERGTVSLDQGQNIDIAFESAAPMSVEFSQDDNFVCDFGEGAAEPGDYSGPYEITPTSSEQYLPTANKTLAQMVTVHRTPYAEVSNLFGGYTVTIL